MYDHLPPRLAKYLAAIYTGTDVPEIERQDTESIIEAKIKAWRCFTKLSRWNKQRGQTINQLNQRIHAQRQATRNKNNQIELLQDAYMGLKRRLSEQEDNSRLVSVAHKKIVDQLLEDNERNRKAGANIVMHQEKQLAKVTKWNNAHKREIRELQYKLHRRREQVKLLLKENDVFSRAIQRRDKKIRELQDAIAHERRQVDALNKCANTYDEINDDLIRAIMQQDNELADWYEYVQLLIAKLNEKEKQLKLSNLEVGVGKKKGMACMNNLTIKTVIDDHGSVPDYSRNGDAAVDLRASESCYIKAGAVRLVDTGVRVAIPSGYVGLVCPRSGMACKHEVTVINSPGVIDPNYRGSIKVGLVNHNSVGFDIREGDRIAQLLIVPVPRVTFEQVAELDDTERGADGFGSSGR